MKSPLVKVAIAALIIVAVGIGIRGIGDGTPAFAQVVKSIMEARTATFKVVMAPADKPEIIIDGQFMDPGLGRHTARVADGTDTEMVMIIDYVNSKGLMLVPSQKTAVTVELTNRPDELDPAKINAFQLLRDRIVAAQANPDESVEYLGESQIDSQRVIGYRMKENGTQTTIWADVDSLLPVEVEHVMTETLGESITTTMMDIEFNMPLDRADFSTEVPEGYTVATMQSDVSAPNEADMVGMFQIWADATEGKFPPALTIKAMSELGQILAEKKNLDFGEKTNLSDPAFREWMETFQKVNRSLKFVKALPAESNWRYVGAGATYGDTTTPVFWYRPDDSETYRVIYADLSVLDVTPDELAAFENEPTP